MKERVPGTVCAKHPPGRDGRRFLEPFPAARAAGRRLRWAAAVLALLAPGPLAADLVVLRNGQELRGRVHAKGDQVRVDLDIGGTVTVARGDIARTEVEAPGPAATGEAAVPADLLARLEAREKTHVLLERLAAEPEQTRAEAERQLGALGRAALPLLRPALDDSPPPQRLAVLRVLTALGDPSILPQVRTLLANPKDKALHVQAAKALAEIGGPRVAPELTALLVNSPDDEVATVALKALAAMRSPFAAPFVVEALQRPALRPLAASALGRWSDPVILPYVLPLLAKASSDENRERAAGWAAGLLTPAHVATLSKLLDAYEEKKPLASRGLFAGVQRLHKDFPVAGDVALLDATQPEIRKAAHESLKKQFKADRPPQPPAWRAEADKATQPTLLLVPVGATSRATARDLAADLAKALNHPVELERGSTPVPEAEGDLRDARRLLLLLDRQQTEDPRAVRAIGVTDFDILDPGRPQALAFTRADGAVTFSLARLGAARGRPARAARLALHALAQSFGLAPCSTATCPAGPVYQARDLDDKDSRYCPACTKAFEPLWDAGAEAARFRYAEAGRKLSQLAGTSAARHSAAAYMFERALDYADAERAWKACLSHTADETVQGLIKHRIELLERAAGRPKRPAGREKQG